ncbi:MAG: alpha-L-rhamnosidase-related protein [Armatimonadota bacterium]
MIRLTALAVIIASIPAMCCLGAGAKPESICSVADDTRMLFNQNWVEPNRPADPGFRHVAVGLDYNPMTYRIKADPKKKYKAILGFCEGFWSEPGKRIVTISIEGKERGSVDTIADAGGKNTPFAVMFDAHDLDRDGFINISVRAHADSQDGNSILNMLWFFDDNLDEITPDKVITGELNEEAYVRVSAGSRAGTNPKAAFQVAGLRCVAGLNQDNDSASSIAFGAVEGFTWIRTEITGAEIKSTSLRDNWLERKYNLPSGANAQSIWYASPDKPVFAVIFRISNPTDKTLHTGIKASLRPNPGYFVKFTPETNDNGRVMDGIAVASDSQFSDVKAYAGLFPSSFDQKIAVKSGNKDGEVIFDIDRPVVLAPGKSESFALVAAAGDGRDPDFPDNETTLRMVGLDPDAEFSAVKRASNRWNKDGVIIKTPDAGINRFFNKTKLWAYKDVRVLPFGEPYNLKDGLANRRLAVLTASPVYHGVFANDNIQSIWEWGALGSGLYPVLENSLDVMLGFDTPESVEWISGDGSIFLSALKIGQHAEWVTGASSLILWSGKKEYLDKYWPKIKTILSRFAEFDKDHDYLDDYSSSTFPEHPDPGSYNHEMLYASAFWYKAFDFASEVAKSADDPGLSREYASTARLIGKAINAKFGSDWGYAGWLDSRHTQHRHINHNSVLPVQYGLADKQMADKVFDSLFSPISMTPRGPMHMDSEHQYTVSSFAWAFQRWNMVHALFEAGRTDHALEVMSEWISQESKPDIQYGAPEAFREDGSVSSLGYSWTAGRALRSALFGLYGIRLQSDGFAVQPNLPSSWQKMELKNLEIRGTVFDIEIIRSDKQSMAIDGKSISGNTIQEQWFDGHRHTVKLTVI